MTNTSLVQSGNLEQENFKAAGKTAVKSTSPLSEIKSSTDESTPKNQKNLDFTSKEDSI